MGHAIGLGEVCEAIEAVAGRVVAFIGSASDLSRAVPRLEWSAGETAAHLLSAGSIQKPSPGTETSGWLPTCPAPMACQLEWRRANARILNPDGPLRRRLPGRPA